MNGRVFLEKCGDYDLDRLIEIFRGIFKEIRIFDKIRSGMEVIIKPNLVMKSDKDSGVITHPNVVAAVGILIKERGASVTIAESSGGVFTPKSVNSIMHGCGYTEVCKKYGFKIYDECKSEQVEIENFQICRVMNVIEPYINADFIIDIAKLKSHCMTGFSGAVKNLFGVVPGLMKPELHFRFPDEEDFCTMLVDLCSYVKPDLSIIDAVDGMEGDGPTGGNKRHIGAVIVSENPYDADIVGAAIANMKPMNIRYLKNGADRGYCQSSLDEIEVVGATVKELVQKDFLQPKTKGVDFAKRVPKFLRPITKKITTPKPVINSQKCIGCGKCAESCPKHTIKIVEKRAVIDYSGCIKCFCCHEMCPKHVIDVKRFSLFRL